MEKELPTKFIAKRVVELLSEKNQSSLQEAVAVLEGFFANQQDRVARAYELAWLVVLKKNLTKPSKVRTSKPTPDADWLALKASKAADEDKLPQAFTLLRTANNSGARGHLCRSVVFQILRKLEKHDRITHIVYGSKYGIPALTTMEVGRLKGSGLLVIRNPGSKYDLRTKAWKPEEGRLQFDSGEVFLKSDEEIRADVDRGAILFKRIGAAEQSYDRIDWVQYLESLRAIQLEILAEAA